MCVHFMLAYRNVTKSSSKLSSIIPKCIQLRVSKERSILIASTKQYVFNTHSTRFVFSTKQCDAYCSIGFSFDDGSTTATLTTSDDLS